MMRKRKDPLVGMLVIGLACLCGGIGMRVAASRGEAKLKTWQRTSARVESVETVTERSRRTAKRTRYATMVRYATPQGPAVRKVVLSNPPASDVSIYYDPADVAAQPVTEASLRSVTSPFSAMAANGLVAAGVVALCCGAYGFRRRMCSVS